ncbi:hypothetical protein J6590_035422 [Homalodisca vitripennis]|nr:hypothetical protein J6590_035422 [Homalodisca vitripennis]
MGIHGWLACRIEKLQICKCKGHRRYDKPAAGGWGMAQVRPRWPADQVKLEDDQEVCRLVWHFLQKPGSPRSLCSADSALITGYYELLRCKNYKTDAARISMKLVLCGQCTYHWILRVTALQEL